MPTAFWLIRHALVEENARAIMYGTLDVPLCPTTLAAQAPLYRALAARLPHPAAFLVTPLERTRHTARALQAAGYPGTAPRTEPGLIEQALGKWQGLPHPEFAARLTVPAHAFWPMAGDERPPGGESIADVVSRVGATMEELALRHAGQDVVAISHGGAIRAAVAHALGVPAATALQFSISNLSLTRLERHPDGWRVGCVNEMVAG